MGWLAIGVLCVLLGLFMLAVGWSDPEIRYGGLALILFLGVGMLGYAGGPLLGRSGSRPVLRSRVETSVGTEPAFTFSTHSARQLAPVVGSFGMAAGSAMLILAGRTAAGVGCTIIFGSWFLFMLFTATRPLQLALTPTRLLFGSTAKTAELPWAAVDGCDLFETSAGRGTATDVLGVAATDPRDAIWTRGRRMAAADRRASGYDLTLPAEAFVADAEAVIDAIHLYRDEPERRRAIGSEEELARLHRLPGLAGRT